MEIWTKIGKIVRKKRNAYSFRGSAIAFLWERQNFFSTILLSPSSATLI